MPLTDEEKAAVLARLPLFEGISSDSLARLTAVVGEQDFAAGGFIVRQGQVGTGLYVVLSGRVRVVRGSDELAVLVPGDFFGELAVIDQRPRGASVEAVEPTRCLALASWDLLELLEHDPKLSLNLIRGLVARIRGQGEHPHH
jgi:CRP/FNR family cyclic AMP-dependent transcriptional regulator